MTYEIEVNSWGMVLKLTLSGPGAISQGNDKRTRQNCNFVAQLMYSWSAEDPAVQQNITHKINMKMAQNTRIPPRSSDLLGTFSILNERQTASSPSLFPSQAIKIFLFASSRPALPTDQFSWGEVSGCPFLWLEHFRVIHLKSDWRCQESPCWLRTTLEPQLNSQFLSWIFIPWIMSADGPYYTVSPQCTQNTFKPIKSWQNSIVVIASKWHISVKDISYGRGSKVQAGAKEA